MCWKEMVDTPNRTDEGAYQDVEGLREIKKGW